MGLRKGWPRQAKAVRASCTVLVMTVSPEEVEYVSETVRETEFLAETYTQPFVVIQAAPTTAVPSSTPDSPSPVHSSPLSARLKSTPETPSPILRVLVSKLFSAEEDLATSLRFPHISKPLLRVSSPTTHLPSVRRCTIALRRWVIFIYLLCRFLLCYVL